jgi:predicted RNA-binding protein associated with RNAse of E/G family
MTEVYIDIYITTRKSDNTNGITDEIFSLEIFTDGNNSISKFVGIY